MWQMYGVSLGSKKYQVYTGMVRQPGFKPFKFTEAFKQCILKN